jgi:hypothetical protein
MSRRIRLCGRPRVLHSWVAALIFFGALPPFGPFADVPPVQSGRWTQSELADWLGGSSSGVYVEGSELRLQDGQTNGTYESQPFQAAFGVNVALLGWHAQVAPDQTLALDLRWSVDGVGWSEWQGARGRPAGDGTRSQLFLLPPFTSWLQYRARFESAAGSPALADATIIYLDSTAGAASAAITARAPATGPAVLTPAPSTITPADSGVQPIVGETIRQTPRRVLLASIDIPPVDPNPAATLRALQWVEANLDYRPVLPYHFMLDRGGTIYGGPGSPTAVLPDVEEGTVSVAVMTDVAADGLGEALPPALGELLGWLAQSYGLPLDAVDVAPDAPAQLRDALPGLRDAADRATVRFRAYLAAGNTALGPERLLLFNRGADEARATLAVLSPLSPERRTIVVPPGQRIVVPLNETVPIAGPLGIEVVGDRPLELERTQGVGREFGGGVPPRETARVWRFAEASSADGDRTTLDLLNPQTRDAKATLTLVGENGVLLVRELLIGARTQQSVLLNDVLPDQRFAIELIADTPIVAERTTTTASGAAALAGGVVAPARRWTFAEGSTLAGYRTSLALFNPWAQQLTATIRVLSEDGTSLDRQYIVPGQSRRVVVLNDIAPDLPFAMEVEASRPLVAERSISFDEGQGLTIGAGAPEAATRWTFVEGATAVPSEYYLLLANPNPQPVGVEVAYTLGDGQVETRTHEVGARARLTIAVSADVPDQPSVAAVLTADRPVVAERTLYRDTFDGRGGETALGIPGD